MKKPMELADQLVREHAERIADTVTRIRDVRQCTQFHLAIEELRAEVVRCAYDAYCVVAVIDDNTGDGWSVPETLAQRNITERIVRYCLAHDAEIHLAIDAALAPTCDGTNEDSLDADWKD